MVLGQRLKELRKDRELSQAELADKLNVVVHTVSNYERGKSVPEIDTLIRLAKFYDVSLDYLLGLIDEPRSYRRKAFPISLPKSMSGTELAKVQEYVDFITDKQALKV